MLSTFYNNQLCLQSASQSAKRGDFNDRSILIALIIKYLEILPVPHCSQCCSKQLGTLSQKKAYGLLDKDAFLFSICLGGNGYFSIHRLRLSCASPRHCGSLSTEQCRQKMLKRKYQKMYGFDWPLSREHVRMSWIDKIMQYQCETHLFN